MIMKVNLKITPPRNKVFTLKTNLDLNSLLQKKRKDNNKINKADRSATYNITKDTHRNTHYTIISILT